MRLEMCFSRTLPLHRLGCLIYRSHRLCSPQFKDLAAHGDLGELVRSYETATAREVCKRRSRPRYCVGFLAIQGCDGNAREKDSGCFVATTNTLTIP